MKRKYILLFLSIIFIFAACTHPSDNPEPNTANDIASPDSSYSEEINGTQESTSPLDSTTVEPEIIAQKPYHVINDNSTLPNSIPEIKDGTYIYSSDTIELTSLSLSISPTIVKVGDDFLNLKIEELVNSYVSNNPEEGFYHGVYILFDGMVELKGKLFYDGSTWFEISDKSYDIMPTFTDIYEEKRDRYKYISLFPSEKVLDSIFPNRVKEFYEPSDEYFMNTEEITVVFSRLELRINYESGAPAVFAEIVSIEGKVYDVE